MNLALANGEHIVKSWEYGKRKKWFRVRGTYSLIVTNKKVVEIYEGKNETFCTDFNLCDIKGVDASYKMKRRFFFFKRGALSVSFYTRNYDDFTLVGLSAISAKGSFLSRIPIIGRLFAGHDAKVKVDVNAAKEIVNNISALVSQNQEAGE